jgi:hypothetical protein
MPKPELEFFDVERLPREQIGNVTGLSERILSRDPVTGNYTRCLYLEPGCDTSAMGVQRHDFWEEVWIISGAFTDLSLGQTFTAGMYACRPPGMPHGPWRTSEGCTTFEIRYYDR